MTKRKKNIIGHDPLAWISVDDEDDIVEKKTTPKSKTKKSTEPHPLGIDVDAFISGFELIKDRVGDIVSDFYTTLFSNYPDVKPLFDNSDMKEQENKLAGAIALLANNINDVDKLVSVLSGLGKSHQKYGATAEHYTAVATTLLAVIKKHVGRKWTKKIGQNWESVLTKGAEVMLAAYEEAGDPIGAETLINADSDSGGLSEITEEAGVLYLDAVQDISKVEELLDMVKDNINEGRLVINISNITRIDASCLQLLYLVFRDADINGYETKIVGVSDAFLRSVQLLGMSNILKVAA